MESEVALQRQRGSPHRSALLSWRGEALEALHKSPEGRVLGATPTATGSTDTSL